MIQYTTDLSPRWSLGLFVVLLLELAEFALARRKRKAGVRKDRSYIGTTVLVVFGVVFIPILVYFIYSVVKDPAFPDLVKLSIAALKERWTSFLSQKPKHKKRRHKHKSDEPE
mgnify:CR=1 FL=1